MTLENDVAQSGYGSSYKTQICKIYKVTDGKEPKTAKPEGVGRNLFEVVSHEEAERINAENHKPFLATHAPSVVAIAKDDDDYSPKN